MIKKIRAKGYKVLKNEIVVEDLARINYLIGVNGSGKTSILELLKIASNKLIEDSSWKNLNETIGSTVMDRMGDLRDTFDRDFELTFHFDAEKNFPGSATFRSRLDTKKATHVDLSYTTFENRRNGEIHSYRCVFFNGMDINPLGQNFNFNVEVVSEDIKDNIIEFFNKYFYPQDPVIRIYKSLSAESFTQIETESGRIINIKGLASGFKRLCSIYFELLQIVNSFNDKQLNVICIEEPEITLHPEYQKFLPKIFQDLVSNNSNKSLQFFISTHSPFVISANLSTDHKVYLLDDGQTVDRANDHGCGTKGYDAQKTIIVAADMIGAGLEDISVIPDTSSKKRVIYCEGTGEEKDSKFYQYLFPEYEGYLNIFVPCGGATDVQNAFYSAESTYKYVFGKDSKILMVVDRSCSNGKGLHIEGEVFMQTDKDNPVFPEGSVDQWIEIDKEHRRILRRKELENYLYDPKVIALTKCKDQMDENYRSLDVNTTDYKNLRKQPEYSWLGELDPFLLAQKLKSMEDKPEKDNPFYELKKSIFLNH